MGNIIYGMISPHPPIVVPQIGGKRLADVEKTKKSLEEASKKLKATKPDTIIIITPHGEVSQTTIHVYSSHIFEGDFSSFGMSNVKMSAKGDADLAHRIIKEAQADRILAAEIQESWLDHGVMVPLNYIQAAGTRASILPIAIALSPLRELFKFGKSLQKAIATSDKQVAVVASADMSHRLTPDAPAGYNPKGAEFDKKLVDLVKKNDVEAILGFDSVLAEEAGQDALWSIAILLGAIDGLPLKGEVLSYEGPFGVGYMVAKYE
jgi:AmmeMemoRadiSam system protein B